MCKEKVETLLDPAQSLEQSVPLRAGCLSKLLFHLNSSSTQIGNLCPMLTHPLLTSYATSTANSSAVSSQLLQVQTGKVGTTDP